MLKKSFYLSLAVIVFALLPAPVVFAATQEVVKFTIGIPGKTGCLVCHNDPSLVKVEDGKIKSLYVSPDDFRKVHKDVACIDCHKDFTYKSIKPTAENWKIIAGTACKDCHDEEKGIDHRKNYEDYRESIHGKKLLFEKNEKAPTCAGCHGYHGKFKIRKLSDEKEMLKFRKEAYQVCGRCHEDYWKNYNDWFHGKAYKNGAPVDSPPCWDCHTGHEVLNSKDPKSPTNAANLAERCSKCHQDTGDSFVKYGKFVHGRTELIEQNPVMKLLFAARDFVSGLLKSARKFLSI